MKIKSTLMGERHGYAACPQQMKWSRSRSRSKIRLHNRNGVSARLRRQSTSNPSRTPLIHGAKPALNYQATVSFSTPLECRACRVVRQWCDLRSSRPVPQMEGSFAVKPLKSCRPLQEDESNFGPQTPLWCSMDHSITFAMEESR